MPQQFNVYLNGRLIDAVFYGKSTNVTKEEVRESLINHDHYDSRIRVTKARS
jgi:hypothetical protein